MLKHVSFLIQSPDVLAVVVPSDSCCKYHAAKTSK